MAFFDDLQAMVAELAAHPDVQVLEWSVGEGAGPGFEGRARRALRWADAGAPAALSALRSARLRWTVRGVDVAVGGFGFRGPEEVLDALAERRGGLPCHDPDSGWLVEGIAVDSLALARDAVPFDVYRPSEAACLVGVGGRVLSPVVLVQGYSGRREPVTSPRRTLQEYLEHMVASRGLYAVRSLDAGDPVLLGPEFPRVWRADPGWLDEILAIGLAWSELRTALDRPRGGGAPARGPSHFHFR